MKGSHFDTLPKFVNSRSCFLILTFLLRRVLAAAAAVGPVPAPSVASPVPEMINNLQSSKSVKPIFRF